MHENGSLIAPVSVPTRQRVIGCTSALLDFGARSLGLTNLMLAQIRAQAQEYRWLDRKNGACDV